jgi:hypothetical protein
MIIIKQRSIMEKYTYNSDIDLDHSFKKLKIDDISVNDDLDLFSDISSDTLSDISSDETILDISNDSHKDELIYKHINDSLTTQVNTLRKELKDVHSAYLLGIQLRDAEINDLHIAIEEKYEETEELHKHNVKLWEHIQDLNKKHSNLKGEKERWIGHTLKFEYLFKQMKKIGLKQSDDIFECFEDIEIPEVSIHIRDKFVPTAQTDNIDYDDEEFIDDEEEDIIGEFINQETIHIDHAVTNNAATMIQRIFRGYITRKSFDDYPVGLIFGSKTVIFS